MVIHNEFPDEADLRALALVLIAERVGLVPLLYVRPPRGRCGDGGDCVLGVVHRVNGRDVFHGRTVVKVLTVVKGQARWQVCKQRYAVLLDDPDRPVTLACKHGGTAKGELAGESLNRVRAEVAAVTRPGQTMHL